MKKTSIILFSALFIVLFVNLGALNLSRPEDKVPPAKLIINMINNKELPRSFRTAMSPYNLEKMDIEIEVPSRKGLDNLRISGSGQFSVNGLRAIIEEVDAKHFYVIDLRQENHGFVNDSAVSWYGDRNQENMNKSARQIELDQFKKLVELRQKNEIEIYSSKNSEDAEVVKVEYVTSEYVVAKSQNANYRRFYVGDRVRPTDETVDAFVAFVNRLPSKAWLHFHCAAGRGRTTTFMTMFDMLKNAKRASFEDIIYRQWLIGGMRLDEPEPEGKWNAYLQEERLEFIKNFYEYSKTYSQHQLPWTRWINSQTE